MISSSTCEYKDEDVFGAGWKGQDFQRTILLVEDEAFVREVTSQVLRAAGYRVLVAADAAEAIGIYCRQGARIDLVLTDVILPGETGLTLGSRVRRINPQVQVLYVTGYPEQMKCGGEECLAKPFSAETLLERVGMMVEEVAV